MSMQDLFAEAVERLKAGEPASSIVASYPPDAQAEISELLAVIELTDQVAIEPLPRPSVQRRSLARAQYLQQAQALRADLEQSLGAPAVTPLPAAAAAPGFWERVAAGWRSLFDTPVLRLAPLAMVIAAVYLATFWTVRTAEAALPGDPVYPLKQWVREQKISLSPPEQRVEAIIEAQEQLALEARTLATVINTRPDARAELAIEHSEAMIYYGRQGNLLLIGPFLVAPNYQPDAAREEFAPMQILGDLQPGATVQLTYRMLPGNPSVVQGVEAMVVDDPKPAPQPTATPAPDSACRITLPADWIPYPIGSRDTLGGLARRSGASVGEIRDVNCLEGDDIGELDMLYLPDSVYVRVTPERMPTPLPTPLPTQTPEPTPTEPPAPTHTPEPPTSVPTDTPPDGATGEPTVEPTIEPTVEPTIEPTVEPTVDGTTVPTLTPVEIPTGEPNETPEPTSTPDGTPDGTPGPSETPTVEPTVEPTGTPEETPALTPTAEATGAPTGEPTAAPTSERTAEPTALPTNEPTQPPTSEPTPVPTVEALPPTPVPPTPVPPTPVPPTPIPPTPVPPTPIQAEPAPTDSQAENSAAAATGESPTAVPE
jgi:hypothetical protein